MKGGTIVIVMAVVVVVVVVVVVILHAGSNCIRNSLLLFLIHQFSIPRLFFFCKESEYKLGNK